VTQTPDLNKLSVAEKDALILSGGTLILRGDQSDTQLSATLTKTAETAPFGAGIWTKKCPSRRSRLLNPLNDLIHSRAASPRMPL
jgi:hypothetical protein